MSTNVGKLIVEVKPKVKTTTIGTLTVNVEVKSKKSSKKKSQVKVDPPCLFHPNCKEDHSESMGWFDKTVVDLPEVNAYHLKTYDVEGLLLAEYGNFKPPTTREEASKLFADDLNKSAPITVKELEEILREVELVSEPNYGDFVNAINKRFGLGE